MWIKFVVRSLSPEHRETMMKICKILFFLSMLLASPLLLSGCGTLEGENTGGGLNLKLGIPATRKIAQSPSEVYTRIASQIHACWLGGEKPLLPDYRFFAEAPSGNGEARIVLHQKTGDESKRGRLAYAIKMKPVSGGTLISTDSYRIDSVEQQGEMQRAVVMWAHGSADCDAGKQPEEEIAEGEEGDNKLADGAVIGPPVAAAASAGIDKATAGLPPLPERRPRARARRFMQKLAARRKSRQKQRRKPPRMRGAVADASQLSASAIKMTGGGRIRFDLLPGREKLSGRTKPKPKPRPRPVRRQAAAAPASATPVDVFEEMRQQQAQEAKNRAAATLPNKHNFVESSPAFAGR